MQALEDDSDEESELDDQDHKAQLEALKETDPEFYKFMLENDKELLEFGESDDEEQDAEMESEENQEDSSSQTILTKEMINKWKVTMAKDKSIRALRKLLMAFRAAVAFGDSDKDAEIYAFKIPNSSLFNDVVISTIKYAPIILDHHLMVLGNEKRL